MIRAIQYFVDEIDVKNETALEAAHKILEISDDDYSQLNSHLLWNKYLIQQVKSCNGNTPEKLESLIKFAYNEFIKTHISRYELFGLKKKDALVYNSILKQEHFKELHDKFIEPLIDVFESYEDCKKDINKNHRDTVLIVTALPLEFRSIVRRLYFLTDIKKVQYESARTIKLRTGEDAFEFVFDSNKDNFIHVNAGDTDPYDRPFYVFAEGVYKKSNKVKKVHILLLPNYGHIKSGEAMSECENYCNNVGIKYSEVIIAGIAGGIDKENEIKLGDLVVSHNIFGSETKKAPEIQINSSTPSDKIHIEKDIEFRSIHKYEHDVIDFDFTNWSPTLFVNPPKKDKNKNEEGFNKVFTADFVSIDTLSKSIWFKEKLWECFPTCKAIEMEAFGVASYIVKKKKNKTVRIIKSVCDYGDFRKNKIWQPYCADVAASFVEDYLIEKYGKSIS